MATYTINGQTFAQIGVLDATLTFKSGQADDLVMTTTSTSASSVAGSFLGSDVNLLSDGTRIFSGVMTQKRVRINGGEQVYEWTAKGSLWLLDRVSPLNGQFTNVTISSTTRASVENQISVSGLLGLGSYIMPEISTVAAQRFYQSTKGDVLRYLLGLVGDSETFVNYGIAVPSLNIYSRALYGNSAITISSALSFDLTQVWSYLLGFRTSYAVDQEFETQQSIDYEKESPSVITLLPKSYLAGSDTVGTWPSSIYAAGSYKEIDGKRIARSFSYTDGAGATVGEIFRNTTSYTREAELKNIIQRVNNDYRDWTGQITTTSAQFSVVKWFGPAQPNADLSSYRFSLQGVPFANMLRSTYAAAPYVALIRASLFIRSGGSTTADYVDVTFPALSSAPGSRSDEVQSYTVPSSGVSQLAYTQQNALMYTGSISARFADLPTGSYNAVTYAGTTYRGVKQSSYDLKNEIVTFTFGATSDLSQRDYVRTLRDLKE